MVNVQIGFQTSHSKKVGHFNPHAWNVGGISIFIGTLDGGFPCRMSNFKNGYVP